MDASLVHVAHAAHLVICEGLPQLGVGVHHKETVGLRLGFEHNAFA